MPLTIQIALCCRLAIPLWASRPKKLTDAKISGVEHYTEKLISLMFMRTFDEKCDSIKSAVNIFSVAAKQIRSSPSFKRLLQVCSFRWICF